MKKERNVKAPLKPDRSQWTREVVNTSIVRMDIIRVWIRLLRDKDFHRLNRRIRFLLKDCKHFLRLLATLDSWRTIRNMSNTSLKFLTSAMIPDSKGFLVVIVMKHITMVIMKLSSKQKWFHLSIYSTLVKRRWIDWVTHIHLQRESWMQQTCQVSHKLIKFSSHYYLLKVVGKNQVFLKMDSFTQDLNSLKSHNLPQKKAVSSNKQHYRKKDYSIET